ncbi:MAG TPA: type 2 lanthipeptide synthetase LanM family protein [Thermoanaerobaculia bacterium]|nr:type 2 lanthipeptide synthetase LanM family protein [Thermoanaerobaculia bacterium]
MHDAPEWFEALTLAERAALLTSGEKDDPPPERMERASKRVQRWRNESDLLDDALFAERLALEGLPQERLLAILAEPASGLHRRADGPPDWLMLLARTFSQPASENGHGFGILELLRPLISDSHARVGERLQQLSGIETGAVAAGLLAALLKRLRWATERALALELHASRLEGRLQGDTPEERFASFVSSLKQPGTALEILRRYPVMARDCCRHAEQWVETILEMIERFAADRDEIVRLFAFGEDPGALADVEIGLSDYHAGGRSVAILRFESGFRVVYKPKPLAVDLRFQELLAWLNDRGDRGGVPPLGCLKILDRGSYGWMEHVAAHPCETPDKVERFHERQGAWVALFYVLEATDFHHENLIAAGEHPIPIDLETLFQPELADQTASGPGYVPTAHTVLRSGLLPRQFGANAKAKTGLDLTGMGGTGGQDYAIKRITDEGTDRMRWAQHPARMEAGPNLPTLNGEPVSLWEQGEAVLRGFRSMYQLICRHREELLAPDGPLAPFAGLTTRTLLRGTTAYAHLLHVANHPDYLQSAVDRDRLFDRLWLDAVRYPPLRQAVRAERADLIGGDVPRFETLPDSTDLLHPTGRIEGFFAESGMELVRKRLRNMSEDDLERQSWLVRASIEATRPLQEREMWQPSPRPDRPPAEPERFLAAARRIGDRLAQLAVEQGELVTWFHLDFSDDEWFLEPMPIGLYDGFSGMALFFAHLGARLGRLTEGARYERLARLALATIRRRIAGGTGTLVRPGAYGGWGGVVYTLTHLGLLWEEPELLEEAENLVGLMVSGLETDDAYDLIAGAAGGAAALLALHRHRPSASTLRAAVLCGEHLLSRAVVGERGMAWPPLPGVSELPLTGFSHGTAGIAWALAQLAHASGEERFRSAAEGALKYERSWFCPERGSWPDLRESRGTDGGHSFPFAWCHGAPGIGLGRIGCLPYLEDPEMLGEIRTAARSTLAEGFGFNHCLCHGDLGNLELVREAGRILEDADLEAEAKRIASGILAQVEQDGPRSGASIHTEIPGLLTGLAGIGYGLMRAACPERVPSVLLLETPARAGQEPEAGE